MASFTEDDAFNEILVKVLIAHAWSEGQINQNARDVVLEWLKYLNMEGPEKERTLKSLESRVDPFQAEIFNNELRAALIRGSQRDRLKNICDHFRSVKRKSPAFEVNFLVALGSILADRVGIERLFQDS